MPVARKENPERKRLDGIDYLTKAVPKVFKDPIMARKLVELTQKYYSGCNEVEILWRNEVISSTERQERLDEIKDHNAIEVATAARHSVLFDRDFLAEQTAYLFLLVREYCDKHCLAFKKLKWEFKIPANSVNKFVKAIENIERACIVKKGNNPKFNLSIELKKED